MNKKVICFLLILSFLVPFFPQFVFSVSAAEPTVSMNEYMDSLGFYWDSSDQLWKPKATADIGKQIEFILADHGYVIRDNPMSVVIDYIANQIGVPYQGKGFTASDADLIASSGVVSQNIIDSSVSYADSYIPYYVYNALPVSDFISYLNFSGEGATAQLKIFNDRLISFVNTYNDSLCVITVGANWFRGNGNIYAIPLSLLNDYSFYKKSGSFGPFPNFPYQIMRFPNYYDSTAQLNGELGLISGTLPFSDSLNGCSWVGTAYGTWSPGQTFSSYTFNVGGVNGPINGTWTNIYGSFYVVPDSLGDYSFIVFKSSSDSDLFYSGDSPVYKFDSSIDLSQFGTDIDYSKLYDIIAASIRGSNGNVIQAINNAADNYLQQQIDLLHDINNALNDGNGQSWLRRIYGILDYNFPLTLDALEDLKLALHNLSVGGGSADLTYTNQVLDQINEKLGILIDQPFSDASVEDMEDLKNLALNKFPFCVFSDIVAISVILNQPPEQPHWQIPMKLPGSESANNIEIDLSWYEEIRDIIYAVFIFIFIIGLLALSVKIFQAVKD